MARLFVQAIYPYLIFNEVGKAQAKQVAEALADVNFGVAYSSDLMRAAETAETIMEKHKGTQLIKTKDLRERCLGKLEGKRLSARRNITGVDETAESVEAFTRRTMAWWDTQIVNGLVRKLDQPTKDPLQVLLVSHGGFISGLVKMLINSGRVQPSNEPIANWTCYNVSITTIELEQTGNGRLLKYSDISHLDSSRLVQANADTFVA
ncbi:hypothetical protein D9758_000935 [Tetrapyrgos nigripes]|uniref:Phosphoglycerate mutase n=1 Tax=Tetrapyrgos nigripes TaxID=182062 RepID=A0A8H5LXX3_9AGAR|nr:hypothetical protein D9758_000935 [Tetrapyrgos nigripes]